VAQSRVRAHGPAPPAAPERIALEQPLSAGEEMKWVEIEGEIQFRTSLGDGLSFEVQDGDRAMKVQMPASEALRELPPSGTRLTVSGICLSAINDQGLMIAAELWWPAE